MLTLREVRNSLAVLLPENRVVTNFAIHQVQPQFKNCRFILRVLQNTQCPDLDTAADLCCNFQAFGLVFNLCLGQHPPLCPMGCWQRCKAAQNSPAWDQRYVWRIGQQTSDVIKRVSHE